MLIEHKQSISIWRVGNETQQSYKLDIFKAVVPKYAVWTINQWDFDLLYQSFVHISTP